MAEREDFEYLSIPLQRSEHDRVCERALESGYSTPAEYVRALLARDALVAADESIAHRIAEGLESGPAEPFAPDFFERLRERVRAAQANASRSA